MNQLIKNYTFSAAGKTVTFTDYASIDIERIIAIKNLTTGGWIYKAVDTVNFGGSVATNVLTFTASNSGMADANKLLIKYDPVTSLDAQLITQYDSETAVNARVTGFRHLITAPVTTTLADSLADGINSFWTQTVANGGTITSTVGEGQLKTSTAVNGSARLTSATIAYYPGQSNWMNGVLRFGDTGVAGNIRRVGMFTVSGDTPQEGFYFELTGTTFNAVTVKAGVATAVASGSFSEFAIAPYTHSGNYAGYEIHYSGNTVWFYIGGILRHKVTGTTTPLTTTLALPITVQNIKTSGATDITFAVRNIGNGSFGAPSGRVEETGMLAIAAMAVGGGTPHDSVDSGSPLKMGAKAVSSLATATLVAAADRTNAVSDLDGAFITRQGAPLGDLKSDSITDTAGTSVASTVFTAVASTRNYITGITVHRTDAATTSAFVDFRDGTGGAILWSMPLPPNGGSILPKGGEPYFRTSANTALAYDVSAALTSVKISVSGFQSKV